MALAMNSRDWMRKLARTFVRDQSVPGWRSLTLSLSAHGLALVVVVWVLALQGSAPVVISPARVQVAPIIPAGTVSLPSRSQSAPLQVAQKNARRAAVKPRQITAESTAEGIEALRQQARVETKALVQ